MGYRGIFQILPAPIASAAQTSRLARASGSQPLAGMPMMPSAGLPAMPQAAVPAMAQTGLPMAAAMGGPMAQPMPQFGTQAGFDASALPNLAQFGRQTVSDTSNRSAPY